MKKLGIFAGGFKPFNSGHFAKICLAAEECDHVIVIAGHASRKKGSDFNFTEGAVASFFACMKLGLDRTFGKKVSLVFPKGNSPIADVFSIIETLRENGKIKWQGVPKNLDSIEIYSDGEDSGIFSKCIGTEKEELYYGDLYQTGKLSFRSTPTFGELKAVAAGYFDYETSDDELEKLFNVRSSYVRELFSDDLFSRAIKFLPPVFSLEELRFLQYVIEK